MVAVVLDQSILLCCICSEFGCTMVRFLGESLHVEEDERGKRSDLETSEDDKRRARMRSLKKKAMNASSKFSHSIKRRNSRRRVAPCRFSAISVGDVRDEKEEEAVDAFRQVLIEKDLLPDHHDDYHTMLRYSVSLLITFIIL